MLRRCNLFNIRTKSSCCCMPSVWSWTRFVAYLNSQLVGRGVSAWYSIACCFTRSTIRTMIRDGRYASALEAAIGPRSVYKYE